ncbi:MAG: DinB family protein [Anaerolineae bacterium]|nr:DinB family protein [Anaerolineae bacterium]
MVDPVTMQPATALAVYLESADGGPHMAHVPSLPGCYVRAQTREEALAALPKAVQAHYAWLRGHGEPAPPVDAPFELEVAGEASGTGPFDPGDAAALFPPDRQPVTPEEMAHYFRLMGHSRADLLALVADLKDEILDWQPDPMPVSIHRLLRHLANAEQWYVSRLVDPETLPAEWDREEAMSMLDLLDMERRTAMERLQMLTASERTEVFHPEHWTGHPEEAWTARKALRRFLEHEREHTAQVRQILSAYRQSLLARLASERAGLLVELLGLEAAALTAQPVVGDWTAKDLLAHVAAWDRWAETTMRAMVAGQEPDFGAVEDIGAANERFVAAWRSSDLQTVLAELAAARASWVGWLESLPVEEFFRARSYGGYDWTFPDVPLRVQWQHDAEHAEQIAAWRQAEKAGGRAGPLAVLRAALDAGREEVLAAARLMPPEQRESFPVCGPWTTHDLLGHLADWEWVGVEGLRNMVAGRAPGVAPIEDIDAWNAERVEARRDESWAAVWADLHAAREAFLQAADSLDPDRLGQEYSFPWGGYGTAYDWTSAFVAHDREHAQHLHLG